MKTHKGGGKSFCKVIANLKKTKKQITFRNSKLENINIFNPDEPIIKNSNPNNSNSKHTPLILRSTREKKKEKQTKRNNITLYNKFYEIEIIKSLEELEVNNSFITDYIKNKKIITYDQIPQDFKNTYLNKKKHSLYNNIGPGKYVNDNWEKTPNVQNTTNAEIKTFKNETNNTYTEKDILRDFQDSKYTKFKNLLIKFIKDNLNKENIKIKIDNKYIKVDNLNRLVEDYKNSHKKNSQYTDTKLKVEYIINIINHCTYIIYKFKKNDDTKFIIRNFEDDEKLDNFKPKLLQYINDLNLYSS